MIPIYIVVIVGAGLLFVAGGMTTAGILGHHVEAAIEAGIAERDAASSPTVPAIPRQRVSEEVTS